MKCKKFLGAASAALMIVIAILLWAPGALAAGKYKTLYKFSDYMKYGAQPLAAPIADRAGNLYGTTSGGGKSYRGVVFKLTPNADGSWTESVLHNFSGADGEGPTGSVIFDGVGNLYGTTYLGGASGFGTIFKLTPNADGSWTEQVIYQFRGAKDGVNPYGNLIFDRAGNLYGVTGGGLHHSGMIFQLTPNADGNWTEKVIYRFTGGTDGRDPQGGLAIDDIGNLYGGTWGGGAHRKGVIFELMPNADGNWTEKVLHHFTGGAGSLSPNGNLIFDNAGNLYGTTSGGGKHGGGVVFKLVANLDGSWTEKVLHPFTGGSDGGDSEAGLTIDQAGNLYGTTEAGSNLSDCNNVGCGVVFKLTPHADGSWKETVLHSFKISTAGFGPRAGLSFDQTGNLYGTTYYGRRSHRNPSYGSVFEITP